MATILGSSFLPTRVRNRIEEPYEEPTFGKCDCTSYSYLALSVVLFIIGTAITISALGEVADGQIFLNLGHMWLIGPIFICSGLMVAIKCMLYLRRKSVIQMIIHQRQLFRQELMTRARGMGPIGTVTSGPPSYEVIVRENSNELPPPSYAEAIALLQRTIGNDAKSSCETVSCRNIAIAENIRQKP
ncbi:uncharacterized protein LOC143348393 isoform X1 [Colletes latitarsis]|uniref:uncharacterized protein LOC143348393 isoform X1 n=1 Tax=Colletes latitarsis TaxID=2605962 RepID=UPI0040358994